ncbi:hypothetical protein BDI4_210005 [Burkholderia diffusa]|nr:hypothetical protein BDI4_210005 [Burkholderia diffusa]
MGRVCREHNVLSAAANDHSQLFPKMRMAVKDGRVLFYRDGAEIWSCNAVYAAAPFEGRHRGRQISGKRIQLISKIALPHSRESAQMGSIIRTNVQEANNAYPGRFDNALSVTL